MSFQAMAWAIKQETGSAGSKLVLLMLADHSNGHTGQCNPSHKRLAAECEMSVSCLKGHIAKLQERGLLRVIYKSADGVNLPNQYLLNLGGVGQNLTEGGSESDGGVGQNLSTNLEDKPRREPGSVRKRTDTMLKSFLENEKKEGRKFFTDDFTAKLIQSKVPEEYIHLAWVWFKNRYLDDNKRYKDWRKVFKTSVDEVWGKLWAIDGAGHYYLTTAGKQLKAALDD